MTATLVGFEGITLIGRSGLEYHHTPRTRMRRIPDNTEATEKTCLGWDFGVLGL